MTTRICSSRSPPRSRRRGEDLQLHRRGGVREGGARRPEDPGKLTRHVVARRPDRFTFRTEGGLGVTFWYDGRNATVISHDEEAGPGGRCRRPWTRCSTMRRRSRHKLLRAELLDSSPSDAHHVAGRHRGAGRGRRRSRASGTTASPTRTRSRTGLHGMELHEARAKPWTTSAQAAALESPRRLAHAVEDTLQVDRDVAVGERVSAMGASCMVPALLTSTSTPR